MDSPSLRPFLSLRGAVKRFGSLVALDGVDLDFHGGEVHAILGENGAGKSTLMKAVYGLLRIDAGTMRVRGAAVRFATSLDARRAGIGMVHQEFSLVNALSVGENLTLSLGGHGRFLRKKDEVFGAARRLADEVGLELPDLEVPAGSLSVGARQRIEILKALAGATDLLILDEPTAVLTPAESEQLFGVLGRLCARGTGIAFITHRLSEVAAIADRVTVMRRGRVVARRGRREASEAELARLMVGELPPGGRQRPAAQSRAPETRLRLRGIEVADATGLVSLNDLDLEIQAGEIFGIAGVDGNGQSELFEVLTGLRRPAAGTVELGGKRLTRFQPAAMIAAGIAHVPPDRQRQGLVAPMSVGENALLNRLLLGRAARGPFLRIEESRRIARRIVDEYAIRVESLDQPAGSLSGGNLQRLVVARALALAPRVLVAFNPTRGLDVAAAQAVHAAIDGAAGRGTAVLLISTDMDEILAVSDRIAVLSRGRLSEALEPPFSTERLGLLMAGIGPAS